MVGLPNFKEIKQQLYAQDARIHLETTYTERGYRIGEWRNEREIRSKEFQDMFGGENITEKANQLPDGQLEVYQPSGQKEIIDVEIDGTAYRGKVLADKLSGLAKSGRPVVWVTWGKIRSRNLAPKIEANKNWQLLTVK